MQQQYLLSGRVVWEGNQSIGIKDVLIEISNGVDTLYCLTDTSGNYSKEIPNGSWVVKPYKRSTRFNGLNSDDAMIIAQFLTGVYAYDNQYKKLASDVSGNYVVSSYDAAIIIQCLNGNSVYLNSPYLDTWWQFCPTNYQLNDLPLFQIQSYPTTIEVDMNGDIDSVNFVGFRKGDVNSSAQF